MEFLGGETGAPLWNVKTSESLLRRIRDWSDNASWQKFFQLYWRLIYSLALKAGLKETEAEDVVQTTMLAVADNIKRFEYDAKVGSFKNWLCHQAQWKIQDHLRRRRREEEHLSLAGTPTGTDLIDRVADGRDSLGALIEKDWDHAVASVALARVKARVKPKQFQMFDLYAVKKWPIQRVSQALQVNVGQVYLAKSRISRLLKKQTELVEKQLLSSLQQHRRGTDR